MNSYLKERMQHRRINYRSPTLLTCRYPKRICSISTVVDQVYNIWTLLQNLVISRNTIWISQKMRQTKTLMSWMNNNPLSNLHNYVTMPGTVKESNLRIVLVPLNREIVLESKYRRKMCNHLCSIIKWQMLTTAMNTSNL